MILEFQFKGNRDYVHGTDMIDKLLKAFGPVSEYSIRISRMTDKNLVIKEEQPEEKIIAKGIINKKDGGKKKLFLIESNNKVSGRYSYDEEKILSNSIINDDEESISTELKDSYSLTENLVALNKELVKNIISSDVKWLFVGMNLHKIVKFNESDKIKITVERKLSKKLIKSDIYFNGSFIGNIKFSSI